MTKLFLYGTLMKDFPTLRRLGVQDSLRYVGKARMRGRMYDIGKYPAAIYDEAMQGFIYGEMYELLDEKKVLQKLDDFEEVHPKNRRHSLYIRKRARVVTVEGKTVLAWAYLYNRPLRNARVVKSGDYKKYVLRTKVDR